MVVDPENPILATIYSNYHHSLLSDEGININVPASMQIINSLPLDASVKTRVLSQLVELPKPVDQTQLERILSSWRPDGIICEIPEE